MNREKSVAHILAGFKTALGQGRYRWQDDKVLVEILEQERQKKHQSHLKAVPPIQFLVQSWQMRMDLGRKLQFRS